MLFLVTLLLIFASFSEATTALDKVLTDFTKVSERDGCDIVATNHVGEGILREKIEYKNCRLISNLALRLLTPTSRDRASFCSDDIHRHNWNG